MQTALLTGPPLPPEEWVCVEDWYSDEEQSVLDTVRTDREVQPDSVASLSVCVGLPSIDTAAPADTLPGLIASHPYAVLPTPPSATVAVPQSAAHASTTFTS